MPATAPWRLQAALSALRRGGVIACPTEAVWGLSCDLWREAAVSRLLQLKLRPVSKGLILVAADIGQLDWLLHDLEPEQRTRLADTWPGPHTWLVPHRGRVPAWVHGQFATVAVRVSAHPVVAALCAAWGGPLVSSSANRAGCRAPREQFQVRCYFGDRLDAVVPGPVGVSPRPSVIRDLTTGAVVRA